jgi:hypothetical protein
MLLKPRSRLYSAPSGGEHKVKPVPVAVEIMRFPKLTLEVFERFNMLPITSVSMCCRIFAVEEVRWKVLDDDHSIVRERW